MRILVLSQYYYPEQFQINEITKDLVGRGHHVTVVCGIPNYPKGIVFEGFKKKEERLIQEEEYRLTTGVNVIHCNQVPRGKGPICLLWNYWSFARESKRAVLSLTDNYDVILGYQLSPITSMLAATEYKRIKGKPLLFYTLDLWPASAETMLHGKNNLIYRWVKRLSRRIYLSADKILVTSRPFIDYLSQTLDVPLERIDYLPQHADDEMISMDLQSNDNGITDFMFAGNLGNGQRLDVIIKAAAILGAREDYKIHLVGDGRMRKELEKMVRKLGLERNVVFYGNQKREDMPNFYQRADALLITLRGNNEVGNTMPGKLQMYMTAGKPILGAINGAAAEIISEADCGSCVKAGDYEGLAKLMADFISHPKDYESCGENARQYFKTHFTRKQFMDSLEKELKVLVSHHGV